MSKTLYLVSVFGVRHFLQVTGQQFNWKARRCYYWETITDTAIPARTDRISGVIIASITIPVMR